ncbi:hypothetical protein BS47DRAFT_952049 [Hydnum rufescens UP504]|uniref:Uncharacterized protein n=1 Tax=Hydnum rufescens UP504 TaxID=1448309 RepID=A0A9P6AY86_9AGAM|nr:hypothetical protein BS47DRAFT_952049 [Hydnum rufescens UP504]
MGSSSSTASSPSSTGRLHPRSRNSSSTKLAPSPLSQSTSAYDIVQSSTDLSRLPQLAIINLDDDSPQIPLTPEVPVSEPSTSPVPADHLLTRSRSASPLKPTSPGAHSPATSKSAPPELKRNTRETSKRTTGPLFGLFGSSSEASTRLPRRRSASATTHRDTLTRKRSRRSSQVGPRPISPSTVAPNIISSPTALMTQIPRGSPSPNPVARIQAEERREKRGSMFGRLLKKFSIVRKPGITWEDTAVRPGKIPETVVPDRVREVLVPNVYPELAQPTPSPTAALAPAFVNARILFRPTLMTCLCPPISHTTCRHRRSRRHLLSWPQCHPLLNLMH